MNFFNLKTLTVDGASNHFEELDVSGKSLFTAEYSKNFSGLTMVLTATALEAKKLTKGINFFANENTFPIYDFPDWETLAYDIFSPHRDIISRRLRTLAKLPEIGRGVLIVPVTCLMHRLAPTDFVAARTFQYKVGETINREVLGKQLDHAGYRKVASVYEHGEYALRGSIVDIFPMGSAEPFRIDLLDNEIESLRLFDAESQITIKNTNNIEILPAHEFTLDKQSINLFLNNWHEKFPNSPNDCPIYTDVSKGIAPQGIEYFLSLFFQKTSTLFDYIPRNVRLLCCANVQEMAEEFWIETVSRYNDHNIDPLKPLVPPDEVFLTRHELQEKLRELSSLILHSSSIAAAATKEITNIQQPPNISIDSESPASTSKLSHFLEKTQLAQNGRVLFCAESPGRKERILDLLKPFGITPETCSDWKQFYTSSMKYGILSSSIDCGLYCPDKSIFLITETELFGEKVLQKRRRSLAARSPDLIFNNLDELKLGSAVVHIEHGVGRYQGLETLKIDKTLQEFVVLVYAGDAKLYVPVSSLHLISRFSSGDQIEAPLHHLGSEKWKKIKLKAARQVRDSAAELLDIYSRRASQKGDACSDNTEEYIKFCEEFPFEETPDQLDAISSVREDLLSTQPMDRLVCGDVGFGKTEVAMRAAFITVFSEKQVVVLVPTTLLAQQHLQTFKDRFANWPISIESLSRFKTIKQQNATISSFERGKLDILIGTHKLLHSKINYENLGMMIIDEEHRFGVRQKEKIKSFRSQIDILALTATPIPRSLNMSMNKIRDLSIIATPPARRLAVKTFVKTYESRTVREAILREIKRGGQVYFLHNDVKSINRIALEITQLVPEAKAEVAHGQMRERELESIMFNFYHQRFNVLVCTTIIETGIDIPSANTILISGADKFGLAQLHQLRGRVGRSHYQAYAYLMTSPEKKLTRDAIKRLHAISEADYLGSGFTLATNDLEIRGAGELLGEEQSGHIEAIGFSLYLEMLDNAVRNILPDSSSEELENLSNGTEVNLNVSALITEDYLPDINMRLVLYKRIANCKDDADLYDLQVEMIDRFGLLPEPTKGLFKLAELRQIAQKLGIKKVEAGQTDGRLCFGDNTPVEPNTIITMVQSEPQRYQIQRNDQLKFKANMINTEMRFSAVSGILNLLLSKTKISY